MQCWELLSTILNTIRSSSRILSREAPEVAGWARGSSTAKQFFPRSKETRVAAASAPTPRVRATIWHWQMRANQKIKR